MTSTGDAASKRGSSLTTTATETSPLLVVSSANDSFLDNNPPVDEEHLASRGQATVLQTILNLMKTCMGTGTLALAFACQQGGMVLFVVGLLAIAAWNVFSIYRLVQCKHYLPEQMINTTGTSRHDDGNRPHYSDEDDDEEQECVSRSTHQQQPSLQQARPHPPRGTSTLGRVAWFAFGDAGLQALDVMLVILLLGIIVAYVSAVVSFVGDTPFSVGISFDAVLMGILMATIALVPDIGYLSGASAIGLAVLMSALVVIAGYGVFGAKPEHSGEDPSMTVWPESLNGVSHWFGIVVFGYGVVPLTYNLQESMRHQDHFMGATVLSHVGVAVIYVVLGVGLYALFPYLTADVLHEIPDEGILPILTRLGLTWTIVATAPLLIVPCAELLEGKFDLAHTALHRTAVRFSVVGVSVIVAVLLPGFVQVLSFVGCFCVATISFIMPPLLHLRLVYLAHIDKETTTRRVHKMSEVVIDALLLFLGIIATVISSICTLLS